MSTAGAQFYSAADMDEVAFFEFVSGEACAFTTRSPGKETVNQDSLALIAHGEQTGVLVVADGLGGLPAGEKASAQTVESIAEAISIRDKGDPSLRERILDGIERANDAILTAGLGSASTVVAVELNDGEVRTYHVGDSAALVTGQQGKLKHRTVPHSPVGYAMEAGALDEKAAMHHPERHLISNVLGSSEMRIELGPRVTLSARDTVILGSDGLFDNLYPAEILEIVRKGPLEEAGCELRERCRARMSEQLPDRPHKPDDLGFILFRPAGS